VATARGRRYAKAAIDQVYTQWAALATPEARLAKMVDILNPEIASLGAQRMGSKVTTEMTLLGEMASDKWAVHIHPSMLPATITEAQFAAVWGLVSHEFEHGIQWFVSAQVKAANTAGITAAELARLLDIPEHVAEQAIKVQNGTRAGVRLVQGTKEFAEAARFESSLIGAGAAHRNQVMDTLFATSHELEDAKRAFKPLEGSPHGDPTRKAAFERLERANAAYDTAEIAYVRLPEEAAAYRVSTTTEASVAERFSMMRELESGTTAKKAAMADMKRIDTEIGWRVARNEEVPYAMTLDFYSASKQADEAIELIEEAAVGLKKAGVGKAP
jgi:hypothetical protein